MTTGKIKRIFAAASIALALPTVSFAVGEDIPWLLFPMGGRAAGMGTAFTAVGRGAEAVMWNPAGLCDMYDDSPLIRSSDLLEPAILILKLNEGRDPVSGYLGERLSSGVTRKIDSYCAGLGKLTRKEVADPPRFIESLLSPRSTAQKFLVSLLSAELVERLKALEDKTDPPREMVMSLVGEINAVCGGDLGCDTAILLKGLKLDDYTMELLEGDIGGDVLTRVNLLIWVKAFKNRLKHDKLPSKLVGELVADLNNLLEHDAIYDADRFAGVPLKRKTRFLAERPGQYKAHRLRVNRDLMESVYPGIVSKKRSQLIFSHMENIVDHQVEYISYGLSARNLGYLAGTFYLGHFGDPIERTDYWGYPQGTIPVWDIFVAATWSFPILDDSPIGNLAFGTNIKLILSMLDHYWGYTFALDSGVLWEPSESIALSVVVKNMGPKLQYKDYYQSDPLSTRLILGSKYDVYEDPDNCITLSADLYQSLVVDEKTYYAGGEYSYMDIIAFRGGYKFESIGKSSGPTYGLGIGFGRFKLDMALMEGAMEGAEQQQVYSFIVKF